MKLVVTGGLGFIGSAVVRRLIADTAHTVLNVDCETYAATAGSVASAAGSDRYQHASIDISDGEALELLFKEFEPDGVIHLAAETHVDRSIEGPGAFIKTNVVGTYELLQASHSYAVQRDKLDSFRLLHVSTDEVFGSLSIGDPPFDESTSYDPRSPYSASKAASDHLVRAWHETFGLNTVITNCSNNYGPFHFPEKLIPLMILKGMARQRLPVYGDGSNIRDWLFVEDHARAIVLAFEGGLPGESYSIGGSAERSNLEVVSTICDLLDRELNDPIFGARRELIDFVTDRPGHDFRYAIDSSKASRELGWKPLSTFEDGLARTVRWYLDNQSWWEPLVNDQSFGARLGTVLA